MELDTIISSGDHG